MIKATRKKLEDDLMNYFNRISSDRNIKLNLAEEIRSKYNLSLTITSQIISRTIDISEVNDDILYCFVDVIESLKISDYFSKVEIKEYSGVDYNAKKKDNYKFKMMRISDNTYIGRITLKELMELDAANMIHYEESTQRAMRKSTVNGAEFYKISINKNAVAAIEESMMEGRYIPNTITLNILYDVQGIIPEYDEETMTLSVDGIEYFDIIDGYHRFVAMRHINKKKPDFDLSMELRITVFDTKTARQFIWQEDQKTKMRKVDSASYNNNLPVNKMVEMLCGYSGLLVPGGFIKKIDTAVLADFAGVFFENVKKENEVRTIIAVKNKLANSLEHIIELYPEMLNKKWKNHHILAWVYVAFYDCESIFYEVCDYITSKEFRYTSESVYNIHKNMGDKK